MAQRYVNLGTGKVLLEKTREDRLLSYKTRFPRFVMGIYIYNSQQNQICVLVSHGRQ
jgi:hypothetical protein